MATGDKSVWRGRVEIPKSVSNAVSILFNIRNLADEPKQPFFFFGWRILFNQETPRAQSSLEGGVGYIRRRLDPDCIGNKNRKVVYGVF